MVCADAKQQTVTVKFYKQVTNYIMDSNTLNLEFSEDLPMITESELEQAIDIKLKSLVNGVDFKWKVSKKLSNRLFQIQMDYLTNIYVKQLYLYFINPYAIHTNAYTISVEVGPVVDFHSYEDSEIDAMTSILFISICIFSGIYLILHIFRIIKESLNLFWAWVDIIQVYNLFLFIDTNHFKNVSNLLKKCAILNFWYYDFIKNYYDTSILKNTREQEEDVSNIPYKFVIQDYQSYYIQNAFFPLFIIGFGLLLLIASLIVCPASRFGIQSVFRNMIQFSLPIRGTLISCCQIFLSVFLFFKNFGGTLNITFSILSIVYYLFCIASFIFILNRGQPIPLGESMTKEKYGSLYEGLILKAVLKRNFNIFFMMRKIIMAICLVFLDNSSMLQMIFILIVQIIFMGLIASKLPYENDRNNFWMVVSEFFLSFFLLLMSAWVIFDYLGEDFIFFEKRIHLSWALHSAILMSVYSRVVGFILEFFYIYQKEQEQSKQDLKLMQNDSSLLDESSGVKQKLVFYHDNLVENQANPNEDIENPDDFQFIEMPDINELIKKEQLEEQEEKMKQAAEKMKLDQNVDHPPSDEEDANHKHSNSANNESSNTLDKIK